MAIHFFVNFDIFKWLYLAFFTIQLQNSREKNEVGNVLIYNFHLSYCIRRASKELSDFLFINWFLLVSLTFIF